jgi:hypothetical protein
VKKRHDYRSANPHCDEYEDVDVFCPSCRYMFRVIGPRAFALGAFVAGVIAFILRLV